MTVERIPTYCALCISRCGCIAVRENGRLLRIEPDPAHPTGKALCIKAKAAPELVDHPERLRTPLRRTRPKGDPDPGWQPLSWDDALDLAAEKLRALGPEATAFAVTTPSGTAIADSFGWIHRLVHAFGSPNLIFATENCNWHKDFSPALTWGTGIGMPDYAHTACILLWGFNPTASWLAHAEQIRQAQRRGAKLIVVDPRRAGLARSADLWLPLRPGTDAALALGLMHLLLHEGGIDMDFLVRHSDALEVLPGGTSTVLEALKAQTAPYTPAHVATLTGVPEAALRAAKHLLAEAKPVSFFTWTGTCQQDQATHASRALHLLYALTGSIDSPGGNVWFEKPRLADISGAEWMSPDLRRKTLGRQERPLGPPARGWITTRDLFHAIVHEQPYPIRGLMAFGGNFLVTKPATRDAEAALSRLAFFAQTELFLTPTARWADLVLPVASGWEREGLQAGFMVSQAAESWIQLRPPVAPAPGDAQPDNWIVFQLACRLGLGQHFFDGDQEAALNHQLAPSGLTAAFLRQHPRGIALPLATRYGQYRATGFPTATGKIRLWSDALTLAGHAPLPTHAEPAISADYPYRLTCGKVTAYCHSQQRNQPSLRARVPHPIAEVALDIARTCALSDGDTVCIRTAQGALTVLVEINADLASGVIWAHYGWFSDDTPINYNACSDGEQFDPVSGSNALRGLPCAIQKVNAPPSNQP